jgi:hypothetical protein
VIDNWLPGMSIAVISFVVAMSMFTVWLCVEDFRKLLECSCLQRLLFLGSLMAWVSIAILGIVHVLQ